MNEDTKGIRDSNFKENSSDIQMPGMARMGPEPKLEVWKVNQTCPIGGRNLTLDP